MNELVPTRPTEHLPALVAADQGCYRHSILCDDPFRKTKPLFHCVMTA